MTLIFFKALSRPYQNNLTCYSIGRETYHLKEINVKIFNQFYQKLHKGNHKFFLLICFLVSKTFL